jgi:hypothetical protein
MTAGAPFTASKARRRRLKSARATAYCSCLENLMPRWIVILKDCREEEASRIRKEQFEEHFAFLRANFHKIVFSCGLKSVTEESESSYGGFWTVEADSKEDVVKLLEQDPYFQLGLRETIDVFKAHEGYI